MEITEIRIKLMEDSGDRLRAFCSITLDGAFVIRDLKIIEGPNGLFVAMPSRKLTARCPQCGCKNHLRASYCNQCSLRLDSQHPPRDDAGRAKLYADVAHPINSDCREGIQNRVVEAYEAELEQSKLPGYVSTYQDVDEEFVATRSAGDEQRKTSYAANGAHKPARGPHKRPAHESAERGSDAGEDGFGAGIL